MGDFCESDFYREATKSLFCDLEMGAALQNVLAFLKTHIPADAISLTSSDEDENCLINHASSRPDSWMFFPERIYMPQADRERAWREKADMPKVTIINDMDLLPIEDRRILLLFMMPNTSFLRLSLVWRGLHMGSLLIFAEGKNRYTEEHVKKMELLVEPFSIAFANLLHYRQVQKFKKQLEEENDFLKSELFGELQLDIIGSESGRHPVMQKVYQGAPTASTVLLLGDTGVGKELVANAIHQYSHRKDGPFIKLNCGAIPESLIDSELFGHERGAFTGALQRKLGRFERAHGGTIFLDEVGELPLSAQARLLRVIQNREIERVGGTKVISVDVRIIAATHQNLPAMANRRMFREDLYYRLNVFPIESPPLRERMDDLARLIDYFSRKKSQALNINRQFRPSAEELEVMKQYHWPGNVRELENVIERALITDGKATPQFCGRLQPCQEDATMAPRPEALHDVIAGHIAQVLKRTGGRIEGKNGAAEVLQMHPSTLRAKMRKLGIAFGKGQGD
ncbi:MAG: sigma-54 interaction domain-containing protein [Halodesulfovibrio sp.]